MSDIFHDFAKPSEKPGTDLASLSYRDRLRKQAQKVVLVMVDDDEDDCYLVEAALKEACFNCSFRCIHDGAQMLEYIQRRGRYEAPGQAPFPDIILLDLNMPRISGREVLRRLKTDPLFQAIPVIILTTSSNAEDVKTCYELGANSYIVKESSFDGLLSAMDTLMEYWLGAATLPPKPQT